MASGKTPIGRLAFPRFNAKFPQQLRNSSSVQSVLLALVEEGLAADAQNLRALADFVARRFERRANGVAFHVLERTQRAPKRRVRRAHRFRKIFRNERSPAGKHQRALDRVSQLAHVAWPEIRG